MLYVCDFLKRVGLNFHLDIIGDGPLKIDLNASINEMGLQDFISLRGNIVDMENCYRSSDIYLHSSSVETFGLVVLEAMASGLPCIATPAKGTKDLIEEGVNGFLFQPNSTQQLSDRLSQINCDSLLAEMGLRARAITQEKYSINAIALSYDKLYKEDEFGGNRPHQDRMSWNIDVEIWQFGEIIDINTIMANQSCRFAIPKDVWQPI